MSSEPVKMARPPEAKVLLVSTRGNIQNIITGLGALYLASVASHFLIQPFPEIAWVIILGCVTLGTLFLLRWWAMDAEISESKLDTAGALVAVLALGNAAAHLYLLSGLSDSKNLALLGAGLLCFYIPTARFSLILSATLGVWLIVALTANPTEAWLHYVFGLIMASGLRLNAEFGKVKLLYALENARQEVKKQKAIGDLLRANENRLALALSAAEEGIWELDLSNNELFVSDQWQSLLGFRGVGEFTTLNDWAEQIHPDYERMLLNAIEEVRSGESSAIDLEYQIRSSTDAFLWVRVQGMAFVDIKGNARRLLGTQRNISDQKAAEEELHFRAAHDPLTRLSNRSAFIAELESAFSRRMVEPEFKFSVLYIDLERFGELNEALGHLVGDEVLRAVGDRLRTKLVNMGSISRFGGDQFVILCENISSPSEVRQVAERVLSEIRGPLFFGGREMQLDAKIGASLSHSGYASPDEMLKDADEALLEAKASQDGERVVIVDRRANALIASPDERERDLKAALSENRLCLRYQPFVSLITGRIVGVEALAYWVERSEPVSEQILQNIQHKPLGVQLGNWVVQKAVEQAQSWRECPQTRDLVIGFNLLPAQLSFEAFDFVGGDSDALQNLVLEISEASLTELLNSPGIPEFLEDRGVRICVDEYGTGQTPFSLLREAALAMAKISPTLIESLEASEADRSMVRVLLNLTREIGVVTVALGVRNASQAEILRDLGCELAQGPYFSHPVNASVIQHELDSETSMPLVVS